MVQIVHYPLMAQVGASTWSTYHRLHSGRITRIVAPLMIVESATAFALVAAAPPALTSWMAWLGAGLAIFVWVVTFFVSVPLHERLSPRFDPSIHARLVATNWLRTVAWSTRAVLSLWMLAAVVGAGRAM